MRRFVKLSLLCLAAGASACSTPDLVVQTEILPYAGVRFINAVPDSSGAFGLDFRFVDILESNAHFRIAFRNGPSSNVSTGIQYKGAREGSRHFRIFLDDTLQSIASTVVKDTTVSLTKLRNYTALLQGNGRSAAGSPTAMRLTFYEEDVTEPAGGKIKLRVINTTSTAIDVWAYAGATAPALTSAPTWDAVAPYSRSTYVEVDSGAYSYQVRNDGAATTLFANTAALAGAVPSCSGRTCTAGQFADIEASPGTRVSGSAVTGIVFPRSTAGSRAPQSAAFLVPAITYTWDRRPPRTCDPYC
jgi:hypothetical protein